MFHLYKRRYILYNSGIAKYQDIIWMVKIWTTIFNILFNLAHIYMFNI